MGVFCKILFEQNVIKQKSVGADKQKNGKAIFDHSRRVYFLGGLFKSTHAKPVTLEEKEGVDCVWHRQR